MFTLRGKLVSSFLIIIVLFVITTVISTILSQRMIRLGNDILLSEKRLEVVQRLNLFARTANDNIAHYLLAPIYTESDFKAQFDATVQFVDLEMFRLSEITPDPVNAKQIERFKSKWSNYVNDIRDIVKVKESGLVDKAQERFTMDSFDPIAFSLHDFYKGEQARIDQYKNEITSYGNTIWSINLIMTSSAILFSIIIAIILSNYLIRRIQLIKKSAQKVAAGDFHVADIRFSGKDELADLAKAFNTMTEALRSLIGSNRSLKLLSAHDGLTGIANRRCYDETMEREWSRLALASRPISLILFDIDYFKKFNDTYGHQAGDNCLKQVADILKSQVEEPDWLAARYGGEEFIVLLPDRDIETAVRLAERFRNALATQHIPHKESEVSDIVTVSIGISTATASVDGRPGTLLSQADRALYQAKREGRNRIRTYDSSLEPICEN
ncbi:diguanylate cyclase [Paenibacillus chartarius]|uniref:Diguanylate cyclase n=1 Tax=Paenibacillus chartarius TaxID=747481 RepID=A0ABV6DIY7_9BACL